MSSKAPPDQRLPPSDPNAIGKATNIDRRTCRRVVPMKVLALGLSRSGTCSLRQGLLDLGYQDCYHFSAVLNENPRDAEMWVEAMEAKFEGKGNPFAKEDWDQILGHCMAITDTPCAIFYRELLAAYPDAKVMLTVRDSAEQWYQSQMKTIMPFFQSVVDTPSTLYERIHRHFLPRHPADRMNVLLRKHYMYKDLPENGIQFYNDYNAEIRRIVPKDNLLVKNVKEGWEPRCAFLGEEVPEWKFPRANDKRTFATNISETGKILNKVAMMNVAMSIGAITAAATGLAIAWRSSVLV